MAGTRFLAAATLVILAASGCAPREPPPPRCIVHSVGPGNPGLVECSEEPEPAAVTAR